MEEDGVQVSPACPRLVLIYFSVTDKYRFGNPNIKTDHLLDWATNYSQVTQAYLEHTRPELVFAKAIHWFNHNMSLATNYKSFFADH